MPTSRDALRELAGVQRLKKDLHRVADIFPEGSIPRSLIGTLLRASTAGQEAVASADFVELRQVVALQLVASPSRAAPALVPVAEAILSTQAALARIPVVPGSDAARLRASMGDRLARAIAGVRLVEAATVSCTRPPRVASPPAGNLLPLMERMAPAIAAAVDRPEVLIAASRDAMTALRGGALTSKSPSGLEDIRIGAAWLVGALAVVSGTVGGHPRVFRDVRDEAQSLLSSLDTIRELRIDVGSIMALASAAGAPVSGPPVGLRDRLVAIALGSTLPTGMRRAIDQELTAAVRQGVPPADIRTAIDQAARLRGLAPPGARGMAGFNTIEIAAGALGVSR